MIRRHERMTVQEIQFSNREIKGRVNRKENGGKKSLNILRMLSLPRRILKLVRVCYFSLITHSLDSCCH